jgi:SEC-C motif-containing protein
LNSEENCPCGSNKKYKECCAMPHQNLSNALTSEALMRSRYTAFVLANGDYLMESQHSMTRNPELKNELIQWSKSVKWLKLEILNTSKGLSDDVEGIVEFKAHLIEGSKRKVMHERSKFVREYGNWVYLEAL